MILKLDKDILSAIDNFRGAGYSKKCLRQFKSSEVQPTDAMFAKILDGRHCRLYKYREYDNFIIRNDLVACYYTKFTLASLYMVTA